MKPKFLLYVLIALAIIAIAAFIIYRAVYQGSGGGTGELPGLSGLLGQTGALPAAQNQQFPSSSVLNSGATSTAMFNASGANSTSSSSKFGIISNDPALDYFVTPGNAVELIKSDGSIETISNNTPTVLSNATVLNIINAAFSYDGKKVFITYKAATTTQTSVFDVNSRTWIHLPGGMQSPVWSPINYQIAYLVDSGSGSEALRTIDTAATSSKPIDVITIAMEDMRLQWPSKDTIIISDRPSAFTATSIWSLNIPSLKLSSVAYESLGSESLWGSSDSALIFSAGPQNAGGHLLFRNIAGDQKLLSFKTLSSKCAFSPSLTSSTTPSTTTSTIGSSSVVIYCAAPDDQNTFSVARLPDEYEQKIYFTDDDFYRVDVGANTLNQIFSYSLAGLNLDATKMKVFNNILFFINRYDQKVYALAL